MSEEGSVKAEEEVEPKIILTPDIIKEGLSAIYRVPGKSQLQSNTLFRRLKLRLQHPCLRREGSLDPRARRREREKRASWHLPSGEV